MFNGFCCLLLLLFVTGCGRVQNSINRQVLDCGAELRGRSGLWVKVLDPSGQELAEGEGLEAKSLVLDQTGRLTQSLEVSSKSCVNLEQSQTFVLRSRAADRNWSLILDRSAIPWNQRVRLQDNSRQALHLKCPEPWISNGQLRLPLVATAETQKDSFALSAQVDGPQGQRLLNAYGLREEQGGESVLLPLDWQDGPARLTLRLRNLLLDENASEALQEQECALSIDRQQPKIEISPSTNGADAIQVRPGELIHLRNEDQHPLRLSWCLEALGTQTCLNAWQKSGPELSFPAPEQGQWTVYGLAEDAAGNRSQPWQRTIQVIQRDLINSIAARTEQALAEKTADGFKAAESIMRGLVDFKRLVLPEEQLKIEQQLIDSILEIAPYIKEKNRARALGKGRRLWQVNGDLDSPYLVLTDRELSLWTTAGKFLQALPVEDALTAEWSEAAQALLLGSADQVQIVRYENEKLERVSELKWADVNIYGPPASLLWFPDGSRFLLAAAFDVPALFAVQANSIRLLQRFELKDARTLAVHAGGKYLAAANSSDIGIWQEQGEQWVLLDSDEISAVDLQFTAKSSKDPVELLLLAKDGRLFNWQPGVVWKEFDPGIPGDVPSKRPEGNPIRSLQAWPGGGTGLLERGGRLYQWQALSTKALQAIPLTGFAWDKLRQWKVDRCQKAIWLQDDRSISFWLWRDGQDPRFEKREEWHLAPDQPIDFISSCRADGLHMLSLQEDDGRLRFWQQNGPLPIIEGDSDQVFVTQFVRGFPEGERLVTAGFDSIIRVWNRLGGKLMEFTGHQGQVNEVRYLPRSKQWLSSAEDSSSRLWNEQGQELARLKLADRPGAILRDGALALDSDHIFSAGVGVLALWQKQPDRSWILQKSLALSPSERSGPDSLRLLQGGGEDRILARISSRGRFRGQFISREGDLLPTDPGLPELKDLLHLELSQDNKRLALVSGQGALQIFELVEGSWQEERQSLEDGKPLIPRLLSWAPDGRSFLMIAGDRQLELWALNDRIWQKKAVKSLAPGSPVERGIRWSADASSIIYANQGEITILDQKLLVIHRVKAFPDTAVVDSLSVSSESLYLAVGSGRRVRLLNFHLPALRLQLCDWMKDYLEAGEAPSDLQKVQDLCKKLE